MTKERIQRIEHWTDSENINKIKQFLFKQVERGIVLKTQVYTCIYNYTVTVDLGFTRVCQTYSFRSLLVCQVRAFKHF